MSLINDALKRAKEAQQKKPLAPTPDLPFRPVEPRQEPARRNSWLFPIAFGVVFSLLAALLWLGTQRRSTPPQTAPAAAQTLLPAPAAPAPLATPPPAVPAIQTALASQPAPAPAPSLPAARAAEADATPPAIKTATPATSAPAAPAPDVPSPTLQSTAVPSQVTNSPVVLPKDVPSQDSSVAPAKVVATPAQAPPLKLQGILYRPANPLAVINGKTVGIGSQIDEAMVVSINPSSALVVFAGTTNKLTLPQ